MHLGCIADDFTGASDLANNLVRAGMRCVLVNGVPSDAAQTITDVDAVVIALKSRTIAPDSAIAQSLAALAWLQAGGAKQIYFKVCSTFDSTDTGNIGPVTEALMRETGANFAIACPAFPENKRTIFKGYLFAGDVLLNESGMQNHPLTPMTDANLVRVMQRQCRAKVGLIDYTVIARGSSAITERIAQLRADGVGIAIVDAISNEDLMTIGPAIASLPVVTAGSGIAIGLPQNFGIAPSPQASSLPPAEPRCAIVSGSCSLATNAQVAEHIKAGRPAYQINAEQLLSADQPAVALAAAQALQWAASLPPDSVPLVYSTADASAVQSLQKAFGVERSGQAIEAVLAQVAVGLIRAGVRKLIAAGGETSGAIVQALAIERLRIGPQIDPGVPWCATASPLAPGKVLWLALKSGNFGAPDFFLKAWQRA